MQIYRGTDFEVSVISPLIVNRIDAYSKKFRIIPSEGVRVGRSPNTDRVSSSILDPPPLDPDLVTF